MASISSLGMSAQLASTYARHSFLFPLGPKTVQPPGPRGNWPQGILTFMVCQHQEFTIFIGKWICHHSLLIKICLD